MGIQIDQITLHQIRMPLVHFFETSFGRTTERHMVLVEVTAGGISGWGEVTAGENPFYNEEWTASIWPLLRDYVAPRVLHHDFESAAQVQEFHKQLFHSSAGTLREEIKRITGVEVREAAAEVEPTTGTVVQVFLLASSVPADTWSGSTTSDRS